MIRDILNGLKSTFGNRRPLRKLRLSQSRRRRCHFELLESRQVLAAPGSPSLSAGPSGAGQVTLNWTAPASTGTPIRDYLVQYRDPVVHSGSTAPAGWTTFTDGVSTSTSATVTGLNDVLNYQFRVAAINSDGTGPFSNQIESLPSSWTWAKGATLETSSAGAKPAGVAALTDGSSIATGTFSGLVDFGGTKLNSSGGDAFVAKFNPDGSLAWITQAGGNGTTALCRTTCISALDDGGAVVAGVFSGTVSFGAISITSSAYLDAFVAKLNPDGSWAWSTRGGGISDDTINSLSLLADGSAIVSGGFTSTASFGTTTLSGTLLPWKQNNVSNAFCYSNFFIAKVSPDGTFTWASAGVSEYRSDVDGRIGFGANLHDIATFPDGSTVLTGRFSGDVTIGGTRLTTNLEDGGTKPLDVFYAKLNAYGAFVWVKQAGIEGWLNEGDDFACRISAAADGTAIATGTFWDVGTFGNRRLTSSGGRDIFVVKLNADGSYAWATRAGGQGDDNCGDIATLADGSVLLLAKFTSIVSSEQNSVTCGGTPIPDKARSSNSLWLVKLSADGAYSWSDRFTGVSEAGNGSTTVSTFADGPAVVAGAYSRGVAKFGATTLRSNTDYPGPIFFIAKTRLDGTVFATVPPPTNVKATAGDSRAGLTWTAPPSAEGTAIADYVVQYSSDNGLSWTTFVDGVSTSTTATVKGLQNGTGYRLRVSAVDSQNVKSSWAYSPTVTPAAVPGPPTAAAGTIGNTQVTLSWTTPVTNGGAPIKDYLIQYSSDGGLNWTTVNDATETATTTTVGGLLNGTSYVFRVAAVNDIGTGAYSSPSATVTPAAVPGPPTAVTGTIGNTQVVLSWVVPVSNGGMPIKDYLIQYSSDGGLNWTRVNDATETAATTTVGGLLNGTSYVFRVAAVNDNGTGTYSRPSLPLVPMRPITVPGAPAAPSAFASGGIVVVWWKRPSTDGNSPIVNYVLEYSDNNGQTWTTVPRNESIVTSWVLVNLSADATYVFRVAAINSAGAGLPSAQSLPIASGAAMPVPTNLAVTAGRGWVSVSWTFPSTNGRAVDGYIVQYSSDGGRNWTPYQYGGGVVAQNTVVVSGLSTRLTYVFRVAALGRGEQGDWSQISQSVVPVPLATAPIHLSGRAIVNRNLRDGAVYLAWTPPRNAGNSRILGYQIQYSAGLNGSWSTATSILVAGNRATIRGLTGGIPYTFRVAAITREGVGPFSDASSRIIPFVSPLPQRR